MTDTPMTVYGYQESALATLRLNAKAFWLALRLDLKRKPRTHTLVIGPTGGGKTYLARHIGQEYNWPVKVLTTSAWVVQGARTRPTLYPLLEWLSEIEEDRPSVVVLDEIDKIFGHDSWSANLRSELFSLLDGELPILDASSDTWENKDPVVVMRDAQKNLATTWIVGVGAFQESTGKQASVGFKEAVHSAPDLAALGKQIPPELTNRFSSTIASIPPPSREDYQQMLDTVLEDLPDNLKDAGRAAGISLMEGALASGHGARFAEDLLAEMLRRHADYSVEPWVDKVEHSKEKPAVEVVAQEPPEMDF